MNLDKIETILSRMVVERKFSNDFLSNRRAKILIFLQPGLGLDDEDINLLMSAGGSTNAEFVQELNEKINRFRNSQG